MLSVYWLGYGLGWSMVRIPVGARDSPKRPDRIRRSHSVLFKGYRCSFLRRVQFLILLMMGAVTHETCRVVLQWINICILLHLLNFYSHRFRCVSVCVLRCKTSAFAKDRFFYRRCHQYSSSCSLPPASQIRVAVTLVLLTTGNWRVRSCHDLRCNSVDTMF